MRPVLARVPGQEGAVTFLDRAVERPHHAYLFAGPEGSGKQLAARAFTAALLCAQGGCGECRDCRLALGDRHPNIVLVEPEGRDIRVGESGDDHGTARWMVSLAHLSPVEAGRQVFRMEQADRMTEEAADVVLKALEEPPADAVFVLSSARPHELPETVRSRCHLVSFHPLAEDFVVRTLVDEGVPEERALVATRLSGGNMGRARRIAVDPEGLAFRDAAMDAFNSAGRGAGGALEAAEGLVGAAQEFRKRMGRELERELESLADPETGSPPKHLRAEVRRIQDRHKRRERRAERDFLDWSLVALESWLRDSVLAGVGADRGWSLHLDLEPAPLDPAAGARALAALEEARAGLADETNLNVRLVVERAFLALGQVTAAR